MPEPNHSYGQMKANDRKFTTYHKQPFNISNLIELT